MMAADNNIREPSAEWEAVERWENEGGRFWQNLPKLEQGAVSDEGIEL
jgi:hypothetical protein